MFKRIKERVRYMFKWLASSVARQSFSRIRERERYMFKRIKEQVRYIFKWLDGSEARQSFSRYIFKWLEGSVARQSFSRLYLSGSAARRLVN